MDSTDYQSLINDILFVLVLYKIELNNSDSFNSLTSSLEHISCKADIFIYDNSPLSMINDKDKISKNWHIHYIHDETNPGVSKGYNKAFKLSKKLHKKWLILLDQDTKFPTSAISKYCKALQDNHHLSLFAPILVSTTNTNKKVTYSPCLYRFKRGFSLKTIDVGLQSIKNKSLLNSGLLINSKTFEMLGGYNEMLSLDFSDFYFIDKYRKLFNEFYVIGFECIHELSSTEDDMYKSLNRFSMYCTSMKFFTTFDFNTFILLCITLVRACKLSIKFRSINFILCFYNYFLP